MALNRQRVLLSRKNNGQHQFGILQYFRSVFHAENGRTLKKRSSGHLVTRQPDERVPHVSRAFAAAESIHKSVQHFLRRVVLRAVGERPSREGAAWDWIPAEDLEPRSLLYPSCQTGFVRAPFAQPSAIDVQSPTSWAHWIRSLTAESTNRSPVPGSVVELTTS